MRIRSALRLNRHFGCYIFCSFRCYVSDTKKAVHEPFIKCKTSLVRQCCFKRTVYTAKTTFTKATSWFISVFLLPWHLGFWTTINPYLQIWRHGWKLANIRKKKRKKRVTFWNVDIIVLWSKLAYNNNTHIYIIIIMTMITTTTAIIITVLAILILIIKIEIN